MFGRRTQLGSMATAGDGIVADEGCGKEITRIGLNEFLGCLHGEFWSGS